MKIKAVFIDMDGTLLTYDHVISPRNLHVINHLKQQGIYVFLATGRQMDITVPYHQMLGLKTPMICLNGAAIYESFSLDPLILRTVCLEKTLHDIIVNSPGNVIIHTAHGMYCKEVDGVVQRWIEEGHKVPVYVGDLTTTRCENVLKYSVMAHSLDPSLNHAILQKNDIIRWQDGIEIGPKGVSKWSGIQYILNKYRLTKQEVIAIGDGPNDIEMLQEAGTGVAMGNAGEDVKAVADFVALPCENDGMADFIEKHILTSFSA
ncbi:HAD family hydrolase [Bacillus sp. A301a_S52]|nr:HAD family hydrolase [Bacillus sp. A301a_S52]